MAFSLQVHHVEPHPLEARHQHGQNRAAAAQVDHLGPHARVEATNALGGRQVSRLGEEGRRVVGLKGTGPWNAWVEGVGQGLLLDDRSAHVSPAVHGSPRGAGGEAGEHVLSQLVGHDIGHPSLVEVQGQEKAAGPETLPHLHSSVADHQTSEASSLHDVLGNVSRSIEPSFLVQLCCQLDVLQRRNGQHLWHSANRTCQSLAHRGALCFWLAIEALVHNWLHKELDCSGDGCPGHFRHQALLHEAHDAMRLQKSLQRLSCASSRVGHTNSAHDVNRIHRNGGDHGPRADGRQRVQRSRLSLGRHGSLGDPNFDSGRPKMLKA
mmetsp:Transcript_51783/g.112820  ORF Transcript_51783/g.112820 Transcript_51783/m.112820 type:complete len:323 (-) Transcript_51783:7-975(-)